MVIMELTCFDTCWCKANVRGDLLIDAGFRRIKAGEPPVAVRGYEGTCHEN